MAALSLQALAKALGGKVEGDHVRAPGPGHSPKDDSLIVWPDGDDLRVYSHAGNDWRDCQNYARQRVGMPPWQPKGKVDGGTDTDPIHPQLGKPDTISWYQNADGSTAFGEGRWEAKGQRKKQIRPVIKYNDRWWWEVMPGPRPLYHLSRISAHPKRQVILVEGEKKCDLAQTLLPGWCITSFSGGNSAHEDTDMSPLKGRNVLLWPDNDDVGVKCMHEIAARLETTAIKIIDPSDMPAKWDIGNAVADGWTAEQIVAWAKAHAKPWTTNVVPLKLVPQPEQNWRINLVYNENGAIKPRVANNFRWLLARHPEVAGIWAWDEMANAVVCAQPAPWDDSTWQRHVGTDNDVLQAMYWLERKQMAPRFSEVKAALPIVAKEHPFHPIRDYLNGLRWDGVARLESVPATYFWLSDDDEKECPAIYGVFFKRWMISAVARVMQPGCKADSMLILEGGQERMKSTLLKLLSTVANVAHFTDSLHDIESKDAAISLQNVWIIELAELNAFQRKDADAIKSWLSRSHDRYRIPWGTIAEDFPRQCIISGTLNPTGLGYLRDPTGARRFWPVAVRKVIDIATFTTIRDRLWAEAVHLYNLGTQWHLTEAEVALARDITEERYEEDPWGETIEVFLNDGTKDTCTTNQLLKHVAPEVEHHTKALARRVNDHLRRLGWTQRTKRGADDKAMGRLWHKPKEKQK